MPIVSKIRLIYLYSTRYSSSIRQLYLAPYYSLIFTTIVGLFLVYTILYYSILPYNYPITTILLQIRVYSIRPTIISYYPLPSLITIIVSTILYTISISYIGIDTSSSSTLYLTFNLYLASLLIPPFTLATSATSLQQTSI